VNQYRPHFLVLCALVAVLLTGFPQALTNALVDLRFVAFPRNTSGKVVLVAIDPPSIDAIGVWPWPRRIHADLIKRLQAAGAAEIAFDVDFSTPSDVGSDDAFLEALRTAGGSVILPSFAQWVDLSNHQTLHVNQPLSQFAGQAWPAIVNVWPDADGIVRRYPYGEILDGQFLASMGALLAGTFENKPDAFWMDFSIDAKSIPVISYVDVLRGDPAALARLKGKKVLIGGTALELGDRFNISNGRNVSGASLQTIAIESLLQGRALHPAGDLVRWGGVALVAAMMLLIWRRISALKRVTLLMTLGVAAEITAMMIQARLPVIIDTSLLQLTIIAYVGAIALDEIDFRDLLGRIAENRFQKITMSLGEGVVCWDQRGALTVWNPGATAIFGYDAGEMIGKPVDRILPGAALDVDPAELMRPGGRLIELQSRRKTGDMIAIEACFSAWRGTDGVQYGAILRDISARKREAERIRYLAEYDTLTGIHNRNGLQARLSTAIDAQSAEMETALLAVSIDRFAPISDMFGREYGDLLLQAAAARLKSLLGPHFVARLEGAEFAAIITQPGAAEQARSLADAIGRSFSTGPIAINGRHQSLSVSIGIAVCARDCTDADELIRSAHLALYRAIGRSGVVVFAPDIRVEIEARLKLETELARAVERGEFELFYQPKVRLQDGRLLGAEALIRWRHSQRGLVSPAEFMPVVNTSPIADRVAAFVMRTACAQARRWQLSGQPLRIAINLSPSQLQSTAVIAAVDAVLAETDCPAHLLELEVTEDILVDDTIAAEVFARVRERGVHVVLDDFGTGYASLTYLKKFPLDGLKIDRSFVDGLLRRADDLAIVNTIISLGEHLRLSVVAEGIEDQATADQLLRMGCTQGQGYFFGRPAPAESFEQSYLRFDAAPVVQLGTRSSAA
jgi:diguanylate cyclase (GGDEF)-like protein/PAS domain S-box-containing protein